MAHMTARFARVHEALTRRSQQSPSFTEALLPVEGAVRRGRDIATDACGTWKALHTADSAALIANELVNDTIENASTFMILTMLPHRNVVYMG